MLVSSVISNYILTLPTLVIELALARLIWKVPSFGNVWGLFVLLSLGITTFAAFGLIVASVTSTMQETQVINNAIWFLFLFFSGATLPIVFFPEWIYRISVFLPATHLVVGLQYAMIGKASLVRISAEVIALAAGLVMALYVSSKLFRWEPEEKIDRRAKIAAAAVVIPFLLLGVWENANSRRGELQAFYKAAMEEGMPAGPATAPTPAPPQH
jgi:ABC-type multidrug transport system permease subunit